MIGIAGRAVTSTSVVAIHARDAETRGRSAAVDMTSTEGLMEEVRRHSGSQAGPMFGLETGTVFVGPTTSLVVPIVSGVALSRTTKLSTPLTCSFVHRILAAQLEPEAVAVAVVDMEDSAEDAPDGSPGIGYAPDLVATSTTLLAGWSVSAAMLLGNLVRDAQ